MDRQQNISEKELNLVHKILNLYKITAKEILPAQKGYRNTSYPIKTKNDIYNLIIYKREKNILKKIKAANLVSDYLFQNGFPTRLTQNKIIKIQTIDNRQLMTVYRKNPTPSNDHRPSPIYACLYNYLPGETISWEAYSTKHIKLLGMTMSNMHRALRKLKIKNEQLTISSNFPSREVIKVSDMAIPLAMSELSDQLERMQKYFSNPEVSKAIKQKLNLKINKDIFKNFELLISNLNKLDDQQILHMDFVRSNILFASKIDTSSPLSILRKAQDDISRGNNTSNFLPETSYYISGILDFEKTSYGPRIIDLARTLAFLIVDVKTKSEEKIRKYFLQSGYQKRGELLLPNLNMLDDLIFYFWFYDFYKFLKHNPYESLNQNEHYLRTIYYLKQKGIIK